MLTNDKLQDVMNAVMSVASTTDMSSHATHNSLEVIKTAALVQIAESLRNFEYSESSKHDQLMNELRNINNGIFAFREQLDRIVCALNSVEYQIGDMNTELKPKP